MKLQYEKNAGFLERQNQAREKRLGKLAELLCGFVTEGFSEDHAMLQEELSKGLGLLKDEIRQQMDAISDFGEFCQYVQSCGLEKDVNRKLEEAVSVFEEKKALCAQMVYSLIPEIYVDYQPVKGEPETGSCSFQKLAGEELPWKRELEDLQEKQSQMEEDIRKAEQERQEAETGFQELMRRNAAERAELEEKKPEIRYSKREIKREGFLGFLKDLFGKVQTETIADDSELRRWQEQVDRVQEGYDAQAREWNGRLEAAKEKVKELETEHGCLLSGQQELEKKIRTALQEKVQQELETCLYGEGGLSERLGKALERDMAQNADEIRKLAEKACREWNLG